MDVLLMAITLQVMAGAAAFLCSSWARVATALGAGAAAVCSLVGLAPVIQVLLGGTPESLQLTWDASHGDFSVALDGLSAFFLLPVLGLSALTAFYGSDYLLHYRHQKNLGIPWFFFNVFVASMVMVLLARSVLLFLVAWEVMSVAAYFLVTFEHEKAAVREAGWIYLIATHIGVIFLFVAFLLLAHHAGGLGFRDFRDMPALSAGWSGAVFVVALIGFGTKAGFVPLHVWLPEAHPAAPSHVSALMSSVMIKMGLYGILRVLTFLGPPAPWWGLALAGIGLATALIGITLALQQRDIKRVLAYSSIENMGLIALALGVALWGQASGRPVVAGLALSGALLHVWNHALMKGLMFLGAGSVLHRTDTKDIEKLGGLMKRMPWTSGVMMLGCVAMAALPPFNGFTGKWLIYVSLIQAGEPSGGGSLTALLSVGLLALVGGLSAIVFVRLAGVVLLGAPRSEAAECAHESSSRLVAPMLVLALLCTIVAVVPHWVANLFARVLSQVLGWTVQPNSEAPLHLIGALNAGVLIAVALGSVLLWALTRNARQAQGPTWGCGYVQPTARMQYTGRSFVEMMVELLLPRFLRSRTKRRAPQGLFPAPGEFASESPDPVGERVYRPLFRRWADRLSYLRVLQQGRIHAYLAYILLIVVLTLAWVSFRAWRVTS